MQNLENLDVFEILITQKLLKCPKDPFVRSVLKYAYDLKVKHLCWVWLKVGEGTLIFSYTYRPMGDQRKLCVYVGGGGGGEYEDFVDIFCSGGGGGVITKLDYFEG